MPIAIVMSPTPAQEIPNIFKLKLTTKLLGVVLLIMGTTVAIVHIPWVITSQRNLDDMINYINHKVTQGTEHEVEQVFKNVEFVHKVIEKSFENSIDLNNPQKRELLYLNLLTANPEFSWLQFGFPNGNFFGANRVSDSLSIVNRDWDPTQKIAVKSSMFYTRDSQGNLKVSRTEMIQEDFYSPQRPWYKAALETPGEIAWSDVYIFRTSRTPGISSGLVLNDPQTGEFLGVVSIAFELKQISDYLQKQEQNGHFIFLTNSNQEIIASSSREESAYKVIDNDQFKLKQLRDASNESLKLASQLIKAEGIDFKTLSERRNFRYPRSVTNEKFFVSFAPLGAHGWIIGTIIPESLYITEIKRNRRILVMGLSITIVALSIGIFRLAKHWLVQPLLKITCAASAIERGDFDAIALDDSVTQRKDEIGHLARVFHRMAQEVYGREKELKQQVTQLQIEIDETKRTKEVKEIVESDFFKDLQQKAQVIRQRRASSCDS